MILNRKRAVGLGNGRQAAPTRIHESLPATRCHVHRYVGMLRFATRRLAVAFATRWVASDGVIPISSCHDESQE